MQFLPQFNIGLNNAFWFSLLFIITNLIVLKIYPRHYKKRVLTMPKFDNLFHRIVGTLNFLLFQGLILLAVFIPIRFSLPFFWIGLVLFIIGYFAYVLSLINYATSNPEKPVVKGMYKISRNPQQITTIIMWVGIGFLTSCFLIIAICILQLFTINSTFIAQEKYCLNKYGKEYSEYIEKTPRYLFKK